MKECPSCGEPLRFAHNRQNGTALLVCDICETSYDCCPNCFEIIHEAYDETDMDEGWGY